VLDWLALAFFGLAWAGYQLAAESTARRSRSLNVLMNEQRHRWIEQMVRRDNRILDVNINASLQNGTAFFASASLIALGTALTLLRSADDALHLLPRPGDQNPSQADPAFLRLEPSSPLHCDRFRSTRSGIRPNPHRNRPTGGTSKRRGKLEKE